MRFVFSTRLQVCFFSAILLICMGLPYDAVAQKEEDPCGGLKTPRLVKEYYFDVAKYKITFPCLARMINTGNYRAGPRVWKGYMLPVIDHYFANKLDKEGEYKLGTLLWRLMIEARDESGAKAAAEFAWSEQIKSAVSAELRRFNKPAAINIEPKRATVGKQKQVNFSVSYINRADIPLTSLSKKFSAEVRPSDRATAEIQGDKVVVTGLKGGKETGTLVVSDKERGIGGEAQLIFDGRMSVLWPIGGLAVTGGAAAGAAATDGGTSTALWVVTGVSAVTTGVLFYKYLRGEGVPFLSESDDDRSNEELAFRFVPGPRSLEFNVRF